MPDFVTCNMLSLALEMYSSAPIKDMGRRGRSPLVDLSTFEERKMLGLVARWGHNTLLVALALMTCVIFVGLFR